MFLSTMSRGVLSGISNKPSIGILSRFFASSGSSISDRITGLIQGEDNDVVVFMKGVPDQPRCGFSNAVVQIMRMHDVKFAGINVLEDEELRQGDEKDTSRAELKTQNQCQKMEKNTHKSSFVMLFCTFRK